MIASFFYHNAFHDLPREDAMAVDAGKCLFVATDGVTRDWDAIHAGTAPYPVPSPATDAADASAAAIRDGLADDSAGEGTMRAALVAANAAVDAVNRRWGLYERYDYLEHDLAGAVAAASVVQDGRLTVGWIGDCGVAVVRDGELAYLTRDQLDDLIAFLKTRPAPYDDARRVFIRRDLRNRPGLTEGGKPVTYGVLTGEPGALPYIATATLDLRPGDVVATHTDGFRPYFDDPGFRAVLCGDPARWEAGLSEVMERLIAKDRDFGRERSVILYRHEG